MCRRRSSNTDAVSPSKGCCRGRRSRRDQAATSSETKSPINEPAPANQRRTSELPATMAPPPSYDSVVGAEDTSASELTAALDVKKPAVPLKLDESTTFSGLEDTADASSPRDRGNEIYEAQVMGEAQSFIKRCKLGKRSLV